MSESKGKGYVLKCLHCNEDFIIYDTDFNCRILRHGVIKATMQPINQHASKEECERLVREGLIYGCGKPMVIIRKSPPPDEYGVEGCDYI
jgi:hypothetical protein